VRTARLAVFSPARLAQESARPVAWSDARLFLLVVAVLAGALCAAGAGLVPPWMNVSMRFDFSPWAAEMAALGGPTRIFPSHPLEHPLLVLLTGPAILVLIAAGCFAGVLASAWWIRMGFWAAGGVRRDRAAALSAYHAAWFLVLALLTIADLYAGLALNHAAVANPRPWVAGLLLVNLVVLGLWAATLQRLFVRTARPTMTAEVVGAVALPTGAAVCFLIAFVVVGYVLGVLAIMGNSVLP
jgi:hypothetical protein